MKARAALIALACLAACAAGGGRARANGAFPDAQKVLVLPDRPRQIVLGTNFGLVRSEDAGGTWTWACEQDVSGLRDLYQFGPAPRHRLFARDIGPLAFTDDGGCTWQTAGGAVGTAPVTDAFPDPRDDARVLAVGAPAMVTDAGYGVRYVLYESRDAGTTFDTVLYRAAAGEIINGVESAASDPNVIYLVVLRGPSLLPVLVRSANGGADWSERDLGAALGPGGVRIIAVDPADPLRVLLRANAPGGDRFAISGDGGASVRVTFTLAGGFLTGFAQLGPSAMLLSGMTGDAPALYRSTNAGASFAPVPNPPRIWSLSERDGVLYGAGQTGGPFAVGVSTDQGTTWRALARYDQIQAIDACAAAACQDACQMRVQQTIFPAAVCTAAAPPGSAYNASLDAATSSDGGGPSDGGTSSDAGDTVLDAELPVDRQIDVDAPGRADAPVDMDTRADANDARARDARASPPATAPAGCTCATSPSLPPSGTLLLLTLALLRLTATRAQRGFATRSERRRVWEPFEGSHPDDASPRGASAGGFGNPLRVPILTTLRHAKRAPEPHRNPSGGRLRRPERASGGLGTLSGSPNTTSRSRRSSRE